MFPIRFPLPVLIAPLVAAPLAAQCHPFPTIDKGTRLAATLDELTWGGLDQGSTNCLFGTTPCYVPQQAVHIHRLVIEGLPATESYVSVAGVSHYQYQSQTGNAVSFGTAIPNTPCNPSSSSCGGLSNFEPFSHQTGVRIRAGRDIANTRFRAFASYCGDPNNQLSWEWRVLPETVFLPNLGGLPTQYSHCTLDAVLARFDVVEGSVSGVAVDSVEVRLTELSPGALAGLANLEIWRDSGLTVGVLDPQDVLVSNPVAAPVAVNAITLSGANQVANATARFLVVADVMPGGAGLVDLEMRFDDVITTSLLHQEEGVWVLPSADLSGRVVEICSTGSACAGGGGQANSVSARLELGCAQTGAIPGPFATAVAGGAPLQLNWRGPAFGTLLLAIGDLQPAAFVIPGVGSLDLLNPLIVLNGSTFPMNLMFTLNSSGYAQQTFTMPAGVPGPFLDVQGLVISGSIFNPTFTLTAAWSIDRL